MSNILVVEDNELNVDMLERRLKKRGYEVVVAVDGSQACDKAQAELPDLILMDMNLPIIDGREATRLIKAGTKTSAIPVIALTASSLSGDREKAIEAGCDEYEAKPLDFRKLLAKMETLLAGESN